nr:MAG TPA: hypothetical protein [Caudoviricetes sp.]
MRSCKKAKTPFSFSRFKVDTDQTGVCPVFRGIPLKYNIFSRICQ